MKIDEVEKWRPFTDAEGNTWDLSFLDAHEVIYTHRCEGKADKVYKFIVSLLVSLLLQRLPGTERRGEAGADVSLA